MLAVLIIWLFLIHPFHVSVLEIEYNEQGKTLQLSQRIFIDDLETALNKKSTKTIDIINMDKSITDPLIKAYLKDKISLRINQRGLELEYLGFEIEEDAAWIYLEVTDVNNLTTLELFNTILLEVFEDQVNLVHQLKKGTTKSYKLDSKQTQQQLTF